ncbi:hypothetical protein QTP88_005887 [Uroleucon formosanum]
MSPNAAQKKFVEMSRLRRSEVPGRYKVQVDKRYPIRHTAQRTTRGHFAADCGTRTPGGQRVTPPHEGSRRAATRLHYNERPTIVQPAVYSRRSKRRMSSCSTATSMACSSGSSLHGIRIWKRQAGDKSGNQPLPEDHNHGNAALVCGTYTGVRSACTGSAGLFGLERLRL